MFGHGWVTSSNSEALNRKHVYDFGAGLGSFTAQTTGVRKDCNIPEQSF